MSNLERLIGLYQKMYELTEPECAKCRTPYSCCSAEYCHMAMERAAEFGVTLEPTGHDTLPLMGEKGCIAEPYLRPLCTLHTCDMSALGFKKGDEDDGMWGTEYHNLRNQIDVLEFERR